MFAQYFQPLTFQKVVISIMTLYLRETLQFTTPVFSRSMLNAFYGQPAVALAEEYVPSYPVEDHQPDRHLFKSSICYEINSKANLQLQCPPMFYISTTIAFTAMSRSDSCGYNSWDCILQEGITQRCDGRNKCSITAVYEEDTDTLLQCGQHAVGKYMYFQVEYQCQSENGIKAIASTPATTTTVIRLNLEDVINMNDTVELDFNDSTSVVDDKTALVGILGGCTLAMVLLIAIISSCIYKIKTRATKLEGYRTATSGISSMCTEAIMTDPELIRQPRRNFQYDYRRQMDRQQPFGRGFTIWNGRSTTYTENDM